MELKLYRALPQFARLMRLQFESGVSFKLDQDLPGMQMSIVEDDCSMAQTLNAFLILKRPWLSSYCWRLHGWSASFRVEGFSMNVDWDVDGEVGRQVEQFIWIGPSIV